MKALGRLGLFYGLTFVFTIPLALVQQMLGVDAMTISLPQFGPGIAAVVMVMAYRQDRLRFTITFKGSDIARYLGALIIPIVVPLILFWAYDRFIDSLSVPRIDGAAFAVMLGGIMLGAFGEELGWRGYAQKMLEMRLGGVAAFLLVGLLWGLWHVGNFQYGPLYMLTFVFSTIGYSAVMAWLLRGTDYNVVLATLFHFGVNVGFYVLTDGVGDVRLAALNGVVWLGAAAVVVALDRERLLRPRGRSTVARRM